MRVRPSVLLGGWLRSLLGPGEEDALGDLDEEFARRLEHRGRVSSEIWYMGEAVSLAAAVVGRRARNMLSRKGREGFMNGFGRDVRQAVRGLAREPGTTLAIVITLAVAVGATTSILAVADAAFLRRLPYPAADRLVHVYSGSRDDATVTTALSPLDLRDIRAFDAVVEEVGAWTVGETIHLTDGDEPRRLESPRTTASLFHILGLQPELGRFFTPDEEVPGEDDAVVISHGLWTTGYGGDPGVVGRTITLDDRSYRVVGVAPPDGALPPDADAWRPLALGPEWYDPGRWGWQFLTAVARLRPGVGPAEASRALTVRLAESVPDRVERGQTRVVRSLYAERVGSTGNGVLLLLGAVGLLLALACANVMNVVLARTERRLREYALRRALGSGAAPLVRLVALETGALAALGGSGGALLAVLSLRILRAVPLDGVPYASSVHLDARVLAFAFAVTAATAVVFSVAPVLKALRTDPQSILREGGGRVGASRAAGRMRDGLVVVQVALACTLLVAVGLSSSAFLALVDRDPGFRPDGVLAASIELPPNAYSGEDGVVFYRSLLDRVRALPGVTRAGAVQFLPLSGVRWSASIELIDPDPAVTDPDPGGNMRPVAPGYFETLGIPVVEGRTFTDGDDTGAAPVVIVDETLARRYWPNGSPVGRPVHVGALSREPATIVGVVGSVPDESLASPGNGHVYFPLFQRPMRRMTLVLRTDADPAGLAPALRAAIREADPRIPVTELSTLQQHVRRSLAAPRAGILLLGTFGAVALLLAAVGIYGVLGYAVARRTPEIGTRLALGAAPWTVVGSIVRHVMRLWVLGASLGAVGALSAAGVISHLVHGVRAGDPMPYVVALAGLAGVALLAALLPAVRAAGVDPTRALRME